MLTNEMYTITWWSCIEFQERADFAYRRAQMAISIGSISTAKTMQLIAADYALQARLRLLAMIGE